jgi:LCP family protein required for cell wall assembly
LVLLRLLLLVAVLAVAVFGIYRLGRELEGASGPETVRGSLPDLVDSMPRVTYNGQSYRHRSELVTVLFMGIDKAANQDTSGFRNGGQADFLMLAVIDPQNDTLSRIEIDRDTMAEITVLGVLGNVAGTRQAQISLSHGFGDGGRQSSKYTAEAVSRLLLGSEIDYYVALHLDSIGKINDAMGGVTVTIEDDFSAYDAKMVPGATLTLDAEQAELFVRSRMQIGDGTNAARMKRQQAYMAALLGQVEAKIVADPSYAGTVFDALEGAMTTNMSRARMLNEANRVSKYTMAQPITLQGTHAIGADGFTEFHVDEAQLQALVIELLYQSVQ